MGEPVPTDLSSGFLEHFESADSEGIYHLGGIPALRRGYFWLRADLQETSGATPWRQSFFASVNWALTPPAGAIGPGADLCLVPGVYRGTLTLRDADGGRAATGGLRSLVEEKSIIVGQADPDGGLFNIPWVIRRDHRGGAYDGSTGTWIIPYENVFAASRYAPKVWTESVLEQYFANPSRDPARHLDGAVRIAFLQPRNRVRWDAWDWVSGAAGGRWTGAVMPGTEIAPREARVVPANFELCYAKLRIQIRSTSVRFFRPFITAGKGSFTDDLGTASSVDDVSHEASLLRWWAGTPTVEANASTDGVVNLVLPAGRWEDLSGVIATVLDPATHRIGSTQLPNMDIDLACGQTCTLAQSPEGGAPLATLCLDPIIECNNPDVLAGSVPLAGSLFHEEAIVAAWWRINNGPPVSFDHVAAGITSSAPPCTDALAVTVLANAGDFHGCLNRIELAFQDAQGLVISSLLDTTIDTTPPTLSLPSGAPFSCGSRQFFCEGAAIPFPVAADNCSSVGNVDSRLVLLDDRPSSFPLGETIVTYRALDGCGNETRCQVMVVVGVEGEVSLNCPPPLVIECQNMGGVRRDDPAIQAWLDSVRVEVSCGALPVARNDAPNLLPSGCGAGTTTTVTFWTTNPSGARVECASTVTVRDTTEPRLDVPPPILLECTSPGGIPASDSRVVAWLGAARAEDDCGAAVLANDAPATFPSGCMPGVTTIVHWRATDTCGLFVDRESSITVVDTRPPTLNVPPPIILECSARGGVPGDDPALLAWLALARASDDCGPAHLTHDAPPLLPGGCEPGVITIIRFVARDECGNESSDTSSVTVVDTLPPVFDATPRLAIGPAILWPPQHGYISLDIGMVDARARDVCGDVELSFAGCLSSQPEDAQADANSGDGGDGRSACDCAISAAGERMLLRAERNGGCAPVGRTYAITVRAVDDCGHVTNAPPFFVCVPHDRRGADPTAVILHANPQSNQNDDACAQGYVNGSYPAPTPHGAGPACGSGCP